MAGGRLLRLPSCAPNHLHPGREEHRRSTTRIRRRIMPAGLRDLPCTQEDPPMGFDELKRRIDHIHRLLLPENAAPGCFTFTEAVGREMNRSEEHTSELQSP